MNDVQIGLMRKAALIMILVDKLEAEIVDLNPTKYAFDFDEGVSIEGLASYIKKGQGRFSRVRKCMMDRLEPAGNNDGDTADFLSDEIDKLFDKHIIIK